MSVLSAICCTQVAPAEDALAAFDAAGGEAEFVDELAEILSIPAARVRVIEVREGSVIISFGILVGAAGEKTPAEAMTELVRPSRLPLASAAWRAAASLGSSPAVAALFPMDASPAFPQPVAPMLH